MQFEYKALGVLKTGFPSKFGVPRQGSLVPLSTGKLRLRKELRGQEFFEGLETFSHVWLIFHFHIKPLSKPRGKIYPPLLQGGKMGALATRTPHRPNPIGLTLAKIEEVDIKNDTLTVSGIDLVTDTPIIDVKPYVPLADRPTKYKVGWTKTAPPRRCKVQWTKQAKGRLKEFLNDDDQVRFQKLVNSVLREDPRSIPDRNEKRNGKVFGMTVEDINVLFCSEKAFSMKVLDLELL